MKTTVEKMIEAFREKFCNINDLGNSIAPNDAKRIEPFIRTWGTLIKENGYKRGFQDCQKMAKSGKYPELLKNEK